MKLAEDIKPVTSSVKKRAALLLQFTAQGEADIQAGRTVPQAEAFARTRKRLGQRENEG